MKKERLSVELCSICNKLPALVGLNACEYCYKENREYRRKYFEEKHVNTLPRSTTNPNYAFGSKYRKEQSARSNKRRALLVKLQKEAANEAKRKAKEQEKKVDS